MDVSSKKNKFFFNRLQSDSHQQTTSYWVIQLVIACLLSFFFILSLDFFTETSPSLDFFTKIFGILGIWFSFFLDMLYTYCSIEKISPRYWIQLKLSSISLLIVLFALSYLPGPDAMHSLGELNPTMPLSTDLRILVLIITFGLYLLVEVEIFTILLKKKKKYRGF